MDDNTSVVCANCGAPLAPGVLVCGHCGRSPRRHGIWWALLQAAAGLVGLVLAGAGGMCSLPLLIYPPAWVFLVITVPVLLAGVALIRWAVRSDEQQTGEMRRKFGRDDSATR